MDAPIEGPDIMESAVISPVVQKGNYFIMDSETLVSNPFAELQQEVANEAQKKNSMTERLTSVKNNVCENHLLMARSRLDRQEMSRLKHLHDNTNKLRHEVKLLDLDRQRNSVEVKKRLYPKRDYSYDDTQILNTERRLGANIASFYLEKKLKYPTRLRSVSDIGVTPTVRKARQSLRLQDLNKSLEDAGSRSERVQTAKTVSTSHTAPSTFLRRRGSKSAPLYSRSSLRPDPDSLPAIQANQKAAAGQAGKHQQPQVKFAFENPLKLLASSEESAKLFSRSYTYYPGSTQAINYMYESSDEDDDSFLPDHIDLRSLLFNDSSSSNRGDDGGSVGHSQHSFTQQQLMALRKAQGPPPKLTTDMKQEESDYINAKIGHFLRRLATRRRRRRTDSDDSSDEDDDDHIRNSVPPPSTAPKFASTGTNTASATNHLTTERANPFGPAPSTPNAKATSTSDLTSARANKSVPTVEAPTTAEHSESEESTAKYSWKHIRGRPADGQLRGTYKSEDLVLQSLTGVPLRNALHTHVPLHSASRAMRHTATFKMHKIVERLIQERTKYERVQVEELKRKMEGPEDAEPFPQSPSGLTSRQPSRRVSMINSKAGRKISAT